MSIIETLDKYNIDVVIIGIVFLSGFFQQKYLSGITLNKHNAYTDASLKVLFLSFIVICIYAFLIYKEKEGVPFMKYFISYFVATSLYDLAFRPFRKWIGKMIGKVFGTTKPTTNEPPETNP